MAWLQENGPDEWHRWAISNNWDYGTDIFEWIVSQPTCDKGTALSLYYATQPEIYTRFTTLDEVKSHPVFSESVNLVLKICQMWQNGAYQTYDYLPMEHTFEYLNQGEEAMLALAAAVPWDVPHGLATAGIHGQSNCFEQTIDGWPIEMLRALGEDWD